MTNRYLISFNLTRGTAITAVLLSSKNEKIVTEKVRNSCFNERYIELKEIANSENVAIVNTQCITHITVEKCEGIKIEEAKEETAKYLWPLLDSTEDTYSGKILP